MTDLTILSYLIKHHITIDKKKIKLFYIITILKK